MENGILVKKNNSNCRDDVLSAIIETDWNQLFFFIEGKIQIKYETKSISIISYFVPKNKERTKADI